jgi:hypothetical protein
MYMKYLKIALAVFAGIMASLFAVVYIALTFFTSDEVTPPEKLSSIPCDAVWRGAADEGFWIKLVEVKADSNKVRAQMFNDRNGLLAFDADFHPATGHSFPKNGLTADSVMYFDHIKLVLNDKSEWRADYPTYGGYLSDPYPPQED